MMEKPPPPPRASSPANIVLRWWIPVAGGVFIVGFAISCTFKCAGQPFALGQVVISDLMTPEYNPRGYGFAAFATSACGLLLLPVAALFQARPPPRCRRWTLLGAWLYRIGLLTTTVVGATTPFEQPYVPIHVGLAFAALMCLAAGLTVCLGVAAGTARTARKWLAALALLEAAALASLTALLLAPAGYLGREALAFFEWLLCLLLAAGTVAGAWQYAESPANQ